MPFSPGTKRQYWAGPVKDALALLPVIPPEYFEHWERIVKGTQLFPPEKNPHTFKGINSGMFALKKKKKAHLPRKLKASWNLY